MATQPKNGARIKTESAIKKSVFVLWISFISSMFLFIGLVVSIDHGMMGYMPSMIELENPQSALSSDVIAADASIFKLLGRYYVQVRSNCKFTDINANVINALFSDRGSTFLQGPLWS